MTRSSSFVVVDGGGSGRRQESGRGVGVGERKRRTSPPRCCQVGRMRKVDVSKEGRSFVSALGVLLRGRKGKKERTYELLRRVIVLAGERDGWEGAGDVLGSDERSD